MALLKPEKNLGHSPLGTGSAWVTDEPVAGSSLPMLIRSTPDECFVILWNGLTLELTYGDGVTQGAWLLGECFLFEVEAGKA